MLKGVVYAAVRENTDGGHEWVDLETISVLSGESARKAALEEVQMPAFYKVHPRRRVSAFRLTEMGV